MDIFLNEETISSMDLINVTCVDWDKPIKTKNGKHARVVCRDRKNEIHSIIVLVDCGIYESIEFSDNDGKYT